MLSLFKNPKESDIYEKYHKLSVEDEAKYSPLFCAIYEKDKEAVKFLLDLARERNEIKETLTYSEATTGENILHVAMKDPEIFKICCEECHKENCFIPSISGVDADGDNVLHQMVEFGRLGALNILTELAQSDTNVSHILKHLVEQKNNNDETPLDLAMYFDKSKTITALRDDEILTPEIVENTLQNLERISSAMQQLTQSPQPKAT